MLPIYDHTRDSEGVRAKVRVNAGEWVGAEEEEAGGVGDEV